MTDTTAQADTPSPDSPLTLADIEAANIVELVRIHPGYDMHEFSKRFTEARTGCTGQASEALKLLAGICSMMLVPDEPGDPYRPMVQSSDGTGSMALEHIPLDGTAVFGQLVELIYNFALKGRLAYVVWSRDRSHCRQIALAAIHAYLEMPINADSWYLYGRATWHRALQLARQTRTEEEVAAIETELLNAFFDAAINPITITGHCIAFAQCVTGAAAVVAFATWLSSRRPSGGSGLSSLLWSTQPAGGLNDIAEADDK